jgi:hypothetical protein
MISIQNGVKLNPKTTDWRKIQTNHKCHHYEAYISFTQKCPLLAYKYNLKWDISNNTLRYHTNNKLQVDDFVTLLDKATQYYQQMHPHNMDKQMEENNTKILYWEQFI